MIGNTKYSSTTNEYHFLSRPVPSRLPISRLPFSRGIVPPPGRNASAAAPPAARGAGMFSAGSLGLPPALSPSASAAASPLPTAVPLFSLLGHAGAVHGLKQVAAAGSVVSSGADGTLRLWDLRRRREAAVLAPHEGAAVHSLAVLDRGGAGLVASAGADGTVVLTDLESGGRAAGPILCGAAHLCRIAARDGSVAAPGPGESGEVCIWDWRDRASAGSAAAPAASFRGSGEAGMCMGLFLDGRGYLVASHEDGSVRWYDRRRGGHEVMAAFPGDGPDAAERAPLLSVVGDEGGGQVAAGSAAGGVAVLRSDLKRMRTKVRRRLRVGTGGGVGELSLDSGGTLWMCGWDGAVSAVDWRGMGRRRALQAHAQAAYGVCGAGEGRVATAGKDGRVLVWAEGAFA